jgi:hypothetical protein
VRITLRPTTDYSAAKANLSPSAKLALRFIEERIRANPDGPARNRRQYSVPMHGNPTVTVEENGDLLICYHRIDAKVVSLDLAIDLHDPPDWYLAE